MVASASSTSSRTISAAGWILSTMAAHWPAMSDPMSHVALSHGERELAGAERLDLVGLVRPIELLDLPGQPVLQHADRMTRRAAGDDGVAVPCPEDAFLDVGVDGALLGAHEARPDLDALGSQRERGGHSPAVGDAAGGDDGNVDRVDEQGHEHHGRELPDVTAGLHALADDGVGARRLEPLARAPWTVRSG